MRLVFLGTPEFAVSTLLALQSAGHEVVGVVTMPDKPAGRGLQLRPSAVATYAREHNLTLLQPEKLKDETFLHQLAALRAEMFVVVAFRMLPEAVWKMPPLGTVNVHASLLPNYRGAAPINWAIINGETLTGVTTFQLRQEIDTGDILGQTVVPIEPTDTAGSLHDKLMAAGAQLCVKTLADIAGGHTHPIAQHEVDPATLKTAPKLHRGTMRLDWQRPADECQRLIRGLAPYPAAWTPVTLPNGKNTEAKIYCAHVVEAPPTLAPGEMRLTREQWLVGTATNALALDELQLAGKKRLPAADILRGLIKG